MLVLTRKAGEELVIGDEITVNILEIRGGRVRLGLVAPPQVSIVRSELRQPRVLARAVRDKLNLKPVAQETVRRLDGVRQVVKDIEVRMQISPTGEGEA